MDDLIFTVISVLPEPAKYDKDIRQGQDMVAKVIHMRKYGKIHGMIYPKSIRVGYNKQLKH